MPGPAPSEDRGTLRAAPGRTSARPRPPTRSCPRHPRSSLSRAARTSRFARASKEPGPATGHMQAGLFAPQQEIREHPAFGRAIGAVRARSQTDGRHVAAQLPLQERFRVVPAELEDTQVAEQGEDASRSRCDEIGIGSAFGFGNLKRHAHPLIQWFNVYYTSVVKSDVPCRNRCC